MKPMLCYRVAVLLHNTDIRTPRKVDLRGQLNAIILYDACLKYFGQPIDNLRRGSKYCTEGYFIVHHTLAVHYFISSTIKILVLVGFIVISIVIVNVS